MPANETKRLVNALMAEHQAGRLRYYGRTRAGRYRIRTAASERSFDADGMWAYLEGRDIGQAAGPAAAPPPAVVDELAEIRRVLVNPSLADQCRTQIRAAMAAQGLNLSELSAAAGRTRQAVRVALRWGAAEKLSMRMAEMLMEATGCGWRVQMVPADAAGAPGVGDLAAPGVTAAGVPAATPEPVGVTRMRAAAIAHEAGVARLAGVKVRLGNQIGRVAAPLDPNTAYRAVAYEFAVGDQRHLVQADVVAPWLTGLADGRESPAAELFNLP